MALGTPTVVQEKKSATAPLDLYRIAFLADDAYPADGEGYPAFQAFVRTALGRDVTVAYVKRCSALKCLNDVTIDIFPTYDVANGSLYLMKASSGVEIAAAALDGTKTIDLIVACY